VYLHEITCFYIKREITRILYMIHGIKNSEMRKLISFPRTFKYTGRIRNVSRDNLEHYLLPTFLTRLYYYLRIRVNNTDRIFTVTVSSPVNLFHVCAILLIVFRVSLADRYPCEFTRLFSIKLNLLCLQNISFQLSRPSS